MHSLRKSFSMDSTICGALYVSIILCFPNNTSQIFLDIICVGLSSYLQELTNADRARWMLGLLLLPLLSYHMGMHVDSIGSFSYIPALSAAAMVFIHNPKVGNAWAPTAAVATAAILYSKRDINMVAIVWICLFAVHAARLTPVKLTFFESGILTQASVYLSVECYRKLRSPRSSHLFKSELSQVIDVTEIGILCVSAVVILLLAFEAFYVSTCDRFLRPLSLQMISAGSLIVFLIASAYPLMSSVLDESPITWIIRFLTMSNRHRLLICGYWIFCLICALLVIPKVTVALSLNHMTSRKLFHFLAVTMFAPVIEADPNMMAISFGVALCALLLVEWFRLYCKSQRFSEAFTSFFDQFIDERDTSRGIAVTHLYLLIGCAIPLWLRCLMDEMGPASPFVHAPTILPHLGWLVIGIGDSFGAIIGKSIGRVKWSTANNRTMEGSIGMLLSMLFSFGLLVKLGVGQFGRFISLNEIYSLLGALSMATLAEAFTVEIDNLLLPIYSVITFLSIKAALV